MLAAMTKFTYYSLDLLWRIAVAAGFVAAEGFVLCLLWSWFVTPFGIAAITWVHAMGLATLAELVVSQVRKEDDVPDLPTLIVVRVVAYLTLLGFGWTLHKFM